MHQAPPACPGSLRVSALAVSPRQGLAASTRAGMELTHTSRWCGWRLRRGWEPERRRRNSGERCRPWTGVRGSWGGARGATRLTSQRPGLWQQKDPQR